MLIRKITVGYVIQVWDTLQGQWVAQEFIGTKESDWETTAGEALTDEEAPNSYLPFHMKQPRELGF